MDCARVSAADGADEGNAFGFRLSTAPGSLTVAVALGQSSARAETRHDELPTDKILLAVNDTFVLGMPLASIQALLSELRDAPAVQLTLGQRASVNDAMSKALTNHRGGPKEPEENMRDGAVAEGRQSEKMARRAAPPMYDWRLVGKSER